jgi:hypothetical protein
MIDPAYLEAAKPMPIMTPLEADTQAQQFQNLANVGQIQQGQIAAQPGQLQAQTLQNQQTQQQLDQTKALNAAYAGALTPGANGGPPTIDTDKLAAAVALHAGAAYAGVMKSITENQEAAAKLGAARTQLATDQADYAGGIGNTVKQAGYSPQLMITQAQLALNAKAVDPAVVQPIIARLTQSLEDDPTGQQAKALTQQLADGFIAKSPAQQKLASEKLTAQGAAQRGQAQLDEATLKKQTALAQQRGSTLGQATDQASWDAATATMARNGDDASKIPATFTPAAAAAYANQGKTPAEISVEKETAARDAINAAQKATELRLQAQKIQQENSNRESVNLTPEARDQMATYFATTGQLPNLGMGAAVAATRAQIINRAAEMFPNVTFASNAANFQANKASLKNVQGTLDTLTAFENTGLKNLAMFTDAAAKIPDTGIPWLNTPVRMLSEKLVGSENMSVVNAARQVALREIARVTNDPKLSGVLSDSSRKEVQDLSPTNATLPQIVAVAKTLQTDMANVHSSLSDQRDAINSRIGTNPTGAAPAPTAPAPGVAAPVAAAPAPKGSAVTTAVTPHVQALRDKYGYKPSN